MYQPPIEAIEVVFSQDFPNTCNEPAETLPRLGKRMTRQENVFPCQDVTFKSLSRLVSVASL